MCLHQGLVWSSIPCTGVDWQYGGAEPGDGTGGGEEEGEEEEGGADDYSHYIPTTCLDYH